jgi:hypothetical protein
MRCIDRSVMYGEDLTGTKEQSDSYNHNFGSIIESSSMSVGFLFE